ncbi:MAG TPA: phage tail tube protein [Ramlibacter sp.]|nr:phage tail tube protein [Ramlibacter sp.]
MATRVVRNTAILCKPEVTPGTDSVPTGAANAMLPTKEGLSITPISIEMVNRDVLRPYLGASEQLPGTRFVELAWTVEMVGSGTVATAPPWGAPLRGCGFAEILTALTRADYLPITDAMEAMSIYWHDSGVLHKCIGSRAGGGIKLVQGDSPKLMLKYRGLYVTPTAVAQPATTLTPWKVPQVVTNANSGQVMFGCTHDDEVAPALVGGTAYPSQGLEIDFGISNPFTPFLGAETVDITDRAMTGKVTMDLTAAQEVAFYAAIEAATLSSIGLQHGTVANQRVMAYAPAVQMTNPQKVDINGKRCMAYDLRFLPVDGNDELRIVTSF